jgi:hypothetical protein
VPDNCSLHGRDKWHIKDSATELGDSLTSVHKLKWNTLYKMAGFPTVPSKWKIL